MTNDPKAVALAYIEGCSRKDFDRVAELLAPDIRFDGPGNTVHRSHSVGAWQTASRLCPSGPMTNAA
jgi:hypothetical protein